MLSEATIARLIGNLSAGVRAETAASVAAEFAKGELNDSERQIAIDILNILARDVEQQVRLALVQHVKRCPFLPPELTRALAADIEAIASPIIRYSTVLTDDDLIAIVRGGSVAKRIAVAEREQLAEPISGALVETGEEQVVAALLRNSGSQISEASFYEMLRRFDGHADIHALMVDRPALPFTVIERLIVAVSDELRERLVEQYGFPRALAEELAREGSQRVRGDVLALDNPQADAERLVGALHARGMLTPTLVLSALCEGNIRFFDHGMARLAGISIKTARILIHDAGPLGLKGIYRKAGLPSELFRAFRIAIDVMLEMKDAPAGAWGPEVIQRIVERVVAEYGQTAPAELDAMLSRLWRRVTWHLARVEAEPA